MFKPMKRLDKSGTSAVLWQQSHSKYILIEKSPKKIDCTRQFLLFTLALSILLAGRLCV